MAFTQISGLNNVNKAAAGYGHFLAINSSGQLFSWGLNDNGQLGNGGFSNSSTPTQVGSSTNWIDVACGDYHSLALNSDGDIYAWGRNAEQQCGINGGGQITSPTLITFPDTVDIDKIAACGGYSLFADTITLTKVYGCGLNSNYLLSSTNLNGTISTPTHMTDFDNATLIAAGPELCGVAKNNSLTVRGLYDFYYDGLHNSTSYYNPVAQPTASTVLASGSLSGNFIDLCIGNKFLLAIQDDNSLWGYVFYDDNVTMSNISYSNGFPIGRFGYQTSYLSTVDGNVSPYPVRNLLVEVDHTQNWRKIVCGRDHILLIDDQNKIYSWGDNTHNQLARTFSGHDVNITEITGLSGNWNTIACGPYNSFGILNT